MSTSNVAVPLPLATAAGEVHPADPRYVQPVAAVQHVALQVK